jgi:hypothetical protein
MQRAPQHTGKNVKSFGGCKTQQWNVSGKNCFLQLLDGERSSKMFQGRTVCFYRRVAAKHSIEMFLCHVMCGVSRGLAV